MICIVLCKLTNSGGGASEAAMVPHALSYIYGRDAIAGAVNLSTPVNLSTHSVLWKVKRAHMDALWALGALPASRRSAGHMS